jgi:hypothetical protein
MLAISRHRHRPLAPWRVMIILRFLRRIAGLGSGPPPPPARQHRLWARARTRQARRIGIQIAFFCHHRACRGTLTGAAEKVVAQCSCAPAGLRSGTDVASSTDQPILVPGGTSWTAQAMPGTADGREPNPTVAPRSGGTCGSLCYLHDPGAFPAIRGFRSGDQWDGVRRSDVEAERTQLPAAILGDLVGSPRRQRPQRGASTSSNAAAAPSPLRPAPATIFTWRDHPPDVNGC